jgi:peptide/nickel transport system permease protein
VTIACAALLIFPSAIFIDRLMPFDPYKTGILNRPKPVGYRGHLLGIDELGRDLLSRLPYGSWLSLLTGVSPVIGRWSRWAVGSGFVGGAVNTVIMRTVDVFYGRAAYPRLCLYRRIPC